MTKSEFLLRLGTALAKRDMSDAGEIVLEYEQHFAFKKADGYTDEEIAFKLGDPDALAAQFAEGGVPAKSRGAKVVTVLGLAFADLLVAMLWVLLWAREIVMILFSTASLTSAACLLGNFNIHSLIPPIPYWCGALFGVSLIALAVLCAIETVYSAALDMQLTRSYLRFHKNALCSASRKPCLPPLAIFPQFAPRAGRRLKRTALYSLFVFLVFFAAGMAVSMLSAKALGFWHVWNWFV